MLLTCDKIARKRQSSKEVWRKIFGTINARRECHDVRLELAKHEWTPLKSNDSLECRNCHSSVVSSKQTQRAAEIHTRFVIFGEATCIDCRKGIAHELPNMERVDPGERVLPELWGDQLPQASTITNSNASSFPSTGTRSNAPPNRAGPN